MKTSMVFFLASLTQGLNQKGAPRITIESSDAQWLMVSTLRAHQGTKYNEDPRKPGEDYCVCGLPLIDRIWSSLVRPSEPDWGFFPTRQRMLLGSPVGSSGTFAGAGGSTWPESI